MIIIFPDPEVTATDSSLNLIKNIEDLVRVNKELKDRNEELEFNMLSNAASSQEAPMMKRKGVHLPESPFSYFRSKMTEKKPPTSLETPPPDL